jgi:hypothetical protein
MRRFFLLSALCLVAASAFADVRVTFTFDPSSVDAIKTPRGVEYHYAGACPDGEAGTPAFARVRRLVVLPSNERAVSVFANADSWTTFASGTPAPTRLAIPTSTELSPEDIERLTASAIPVKGSFTTVYPSEVARLIAVGDFDGARVATVEVCPFSWDPTDERVLFSRRVEVTVRTEAATPPRYRARRFNFDPREQVFASVVANLSDVPRWAANTATVVSAPDFYNSHDIDLLPNIESEPVAHLVVGPDSFASAVAPLVQWRTRLGTPSLFVPLSFVDANYPGSDGAERLRNYLKDAYDRWGTCDVTLFGDDGVVPIRLGTWRFLGFGDPTDIATDLYYACLDGNWNYDGDDVWGESDEDDKYPELGVTRYPVRTVLEAEGAVAKILRYERYPNNTSLASAAFAAGYSQAGVPTPIDVTRQVFVPMMPPGITPFEIYSDHGLFGGDVEFNRASLLSALSGTHGLVSHFGHGSQYVLGAGYVLTHEVVGRVDADGLSYVSPFRPGGAPYLMFSLACNANAFSDDCVGEHLMRNPDGGPVALYGHSSPVMDVQYGGIHWFLQQLYKQDVYYYGANMRGVFSLLSYDPYLAYSTAPFGDAGMRFFVGPPRVVEMSAMPEQINVATSTVFVKVTQDYIPVIDAIVCLSGPGDSYVVGTTGQDGIAELAVAFTDTGRVEVVASGSQIRPVIDTLEIGQVAESYVVLVGASVDDSPPGGDGDGVLDAGEDAALAMQLYNAGASPAAQDSAVFRCEGLVVNDSTVYIPSIPSYGTITTGYDVSAVVPADADDSLYVTGDLYSQQRTYESFVEFYLGAPVLRVKRVGYEDGNDGAPQFGDTASVSISLENVGRDGAFAVAARLLSNPLLNVISDSGWVALVPSDDSASLAPPFIVAPTGSYLGGSLPVLIEVVDHRVVFDTVEIELNRPPIPTDLEFTSDESSVTLTWAPSEDSTVIGYRVYRSNYAAGSYLPISGEHWGLSATFTDEPLPSRTQYYYRVSALASGGRESATSDSLLAWTSLGLLPGWPQLQSERIVAAPLVYDFDGDEDFEIVSASKEGDVYVFHHDGSEFIDLLPATVDPFFSMPGANTPSAHGVWAAPAVADLEGDGSPELVVLGWLNSFDEDSLFVVESDGTVAPGWPQMEIGGTYGSVTVADLEDDGQLEIFHQVDLQPLLYGWRADGTEIIDGDNDPSTVGVFAVHAEPPGGHFWVSPVVADLNGDGVNEVVAAGARRTDVDIHLHVYAPDGVVRPGFPATIPGIMIRPYIAVGDLDGDTATNEILCSIFAEDGYTTRVYAVRHDGTYVPGWPVDLVGLDGYSGPVLGDVDGDGMLEVAFQTSREVVVLENDGNYCAGWPATKERVMWDHQPPIIADVDGDGRGDVVAASRSPSGHYGSVGAYNVVDGTARLLPGWPVVLTDGSCVAPVASDVDADGDMDLVVAGFDANLYVYETEAPYFAAASHWPMLKRDPWRSGVYSKPDLLPIPVVLLRRDADADGVPDLLGAEVKVRGVVVSPPFDSSSTFVFFADESGGVLVTDATFHTWTQSDSLEVIGVVGQDSGATTLILNSYVPLGTGIEPTPWAVSLSALADSVGEQREGDLVYATDLVPIGTWPPAGSDGEMWVTDGADTVAMFIDKDTDIDGSSPPWPFDLTALVWQRDPTPPYRSGYTLLPRSLSDFAPVGADVGNALPTKYALHAPYPNPFNPTLSIRYDLPRPSRVSIDVFNVLGRKVTTLVNGEMPAGWHSVGWNASGLASGLYFVRVRAGDFSATRKAVLLK